MMGLMASMKKTHKSVKYDVNVKTMNIRTRVVRVSVSDVYFTDCTNKVAYKLKKDQPNRVSKSDNAAKTASTLKRTI